MTKSSKPEQFDVVIAGGGLVGASLGCALASTKLRVAIVEAVALGAEAQPSYDERVTAVAWGSRNIFSALGLWPGMAAAATPITAVHVSESGRFGMTRLSAQEEKVDALGYVVANRVIGRVLLEKLSQATNVQWFCPARVTHFRAEQAAIRVGCEFGTENIELSARLLVGADGARSALREQLNVQPRVWDYAQTALVTTVTVGRDHGNVAYERFSRQGPIAMLPLADKRCGVVWTLAENRKDEILALNDTDFAARLHAAFGNRLGGIERVGRRFNYPLYLVNTRQQAHPRLVLVGNAAHSLHPIAGQGFNLSLRDVAVLAELIVDAGDALGSEAMLARYVERRLADQRRMVAFTDALNRLFRNPLAPLGALRSLGMFALNMTPPLKHRLARYTMGLTDTPSRLDAGTERQ